VRAEPVIDGVLLALHGRYHHSLLASQFAHAGLNGRFVTILHQLSHLLLCRCKMFCEAPRTCCFGHICVLRVPCLEHVPQSTRRTALRRAEEPHDSPEPRHPHQRTHELARSCW